MMLRSSLSAFAALLLWANVSNACAPHDADLSPNLIQQERQDIIAAQAAASFMAVEAELAADADRLTDYTVPAETWTRQANIGAYVLAVEAELDADADREIGSIVPNWTLLHDHEGESFTFLTASEMAASAHLSGDYAAREPGDLLPVADADESVRRFFVEVENVVAVSAVIGELVEPETTGSTSMAQNRVGLALDGFEDR